MKRLWKCCFGRCLLNTCPFMISWYFLLNSSVLAIEMRQFLEVPARFNLNLRSPANKLQDEEHHKLWRGLSAVDISDEVGFFCSPCFILKLIIRRK